MTKESSEREVPSTRGESQDSLLGEKGRQEVRKGEEIPNIKNVNKKWTEILLEDDKEIEELNRYVIKKAIIQIMKREENNPLNNWTDKFIRVNHTTYVPEEVANDRNGRMIYTPIIPTEKPKISC